jgi:hypothetical protein
MTKIEKLISAHKLIMKGDLSLFDKIYHQDYQSYNPRLGITNNLADDRVIYASVPGYAVYGPWQIVYETDNFACFTVLSKKNLGDGIFDFDLTMAAVTFEKEKVIKQQTVIEKLDYDPSEGQDWNWEDYE